jgi:hypothetical protein
MNKIQLKVKAQNNIPAVQYAVVDDLASALYVEAEMIMTDSKSNYVPVDSGALRNSGTVLPPNITGNTVEVKLGFGGASVLYARKIHEAPKSWGQGRNKYLSKPLYKASHGMAQRISNRMRDRVSRRSNP